MNEVLAQCYYRELDKIRQHHQEPSLSLMGLGEIIARIFEELCKNHKVQLNDAYLRINYLSELSGLSKSLIWRINLLRRRAKQAAQGKILSEQDFLNSFKTACICLQTLSKLPIPPNLQAFLPQEDTEEESYARKFKAKEQLDSIRVLALRLSERKHAFWITLEGMEGQAEYEVLCGVAGYNEELRDSVEVLSRNFDLGQGRLHVYLQLMQVLVNERGEWLPQNLIIEPDYLVDVTTIARCFGNGTGNPAQALVQKFMSSPPSVAMTRGNIVNGILDRLISEPEVSLETIFKEAFQTSPLDFIAYTDEEIKGLRRDLEGHYQCLKRVIASDLPAENIEPSRAILEPSFYSNRYGLQGRLDLWDYEEGQVAKVVELKSGSIWRPNSYQIGAEHYYQVVLYDLLVRSVYGDKIKNLAKFILYSKEFERPLRHAPSARTAEQLVLLHRNRIVGMERSLMALDRQLAEEKIGVFENLHFFANHFSGFSARDFQTLLQSYQAASDLERQYFQAFVAFVAREQYYAKVGLEQQGQLNGAAALWLKSFEEKEEQFELLNDLSITAIDLSSVKTELRLERGSRCNPLANFRKGDAVVLYPVKQDGDTVLEHQIFKGFLGELNRAEIQLKLNSKQTTAEVFQKFEYWRIEKDHSDSGFNHLHRSLFQFLLASASRKARFLGLTRPSFSSEGALAGPFLHDNSTLEQRAILAQMLRAEDYYLLVGPPGTGKTQYILANFVDYLLKYTQERILLLAYTNRAVDEICEAIQGFAAASMLRISNAYSTDERFWPYLLEKQVMKTTSRRDLRQIFDSKRVFVATIAKLNAQPHLLDYLKPDTLVVDEASQVLEPYLAGILTKVKRFILIGDHKQLPAVVLQSAEDSALDLPSLGALGLRDRRNSLFERLYERAKAEKWTEAYGHLTHQGRMHEVIMAFPAEYYYEGQLRILEGQAGLRQGGALSYVLPQGADDLMRYLSEVRIGFFDVPVQGIYQKSNEAEARRVVDLILAFRALYKASGREFKEKTLGVITPFRAQIAQIRYLLEAEVADLSMEAAAWIDLITIDTVERYQGGARDIILFSVAASTSGQLNRLVSPSADGLVDRKLNVAITRAREHFYLLGYGDLLQEQEHYARLMAFLGGRKPPKSPR